MSDQKKLSAEKYLQQLETLDTNINQNLERLADMQINMCNVGGIDYSAERVQTSPSGDDLCKGVSAYVDFNNKINEEIDNFIDAKNKIIQEIRDLHDADYIQVLFKKYVQFKTLTIAAREMKRSYNYVLNVHKKALAAFEEAHENLYYYY